jgi:hypothetical protein
MSEVGMNGTAEPAHAPANGRVGAAVLWCIVAALACFVVAWPALHGLAATNDDIKFLRTTDRGLSAWGAIANAWKTSPAFRPVEILVAAGGDDVTLECPWVIPVHAAGLAVLAVAVVGLVRRAIPGSAAAAPLALVWILLSPATTVSAWQMDCGSQTWSAALGAWGMLLAWRAFDAARGGRTAWSTLGWLALVFLLGVNVKETFYGWSAAIGTATIVAAALLARRDRAAALRAAWILLPVVALPVAHLAARALTGSIFAVATDGPGSRYQAEFGLNIVVNVAMMVAGCVGTGPFHVVMDDGASPLLRVLPVLALLLLGGMIIAAVGLAWLHRKSAGWRAIGVPVAVAAVAFASTAATIPMGNVSELYCFGANVGVAVLFAAVVVCLWDPVAADERLIGRGVVAIAGGLVLAIGVFGLAGRAHHFRVTWEVSGIVNRKVLEFQPTLASRGTVKASGVVYFPSSCILQRTYGQYVSPPAQLLDVDDTEPWLNRRDPGRMIVFAMDTPPGITDGTDLVLDCDSLPKHGHW